MKEFVQPYILDDQVGYVLRRVTQRHLSIFSAIIPAVTTTQFAAMARLYEQGPLSQNQLGRATAMDAATIKGVVGRLALQGFVTISSDPADRRRLIVTLTDLGRETVTASMEKALRVTEETLAPLDQEERKHLLALLTKLT